MSNEAPGFNKNQGESIIILTKFLQVTTVQAGHKKWFNEGATCQEGST
jgi:hypothetical protein